VIRRIFPSYSFNYFCPHNVSNSFHRLDVLKEIEQDAVRRSLTYKYSKYYFSRPEIRFRNLSVDILEIGGSVHSVADVEVSSRNFEERVEFGPYRVSIQWTGQVLGRYTLISRFRDAELFHVHSFPIALIRGLAAGEQEPIGCQIMDRAKGRTTFKVRGYSQEVVVSDAMRLKINDWRGKGGCLGLLQHFIAIGAMDQETFEVIKSKSLGTGTGTQDKRVETKAQAIVDLSQEEARRLEVAIKTKRPLSGDDWKRLLDYSSRQGAYAYFEKMRKLELLGLIKSERGIEVTPTNKAPEYLKSRIEAIDSPGSSVEASAG
jgi:hypothetical protein